MSTYVYRFVGLETLPARQAIRQRIRSDRRVASALQLFFLRACDRLMNRFSVMPRNLLRYWPRPLRRRR